MDRKIIGLLCAWSAEDFIGPALIQASKYCDEVFVNISSHTDAMDGFEDLTAYNFAKIFRKIIQEKNNITLINMGPRQSLTNHSIRKAAILNAMLSHSKYYEVNNWIWTLDADELYSQQSYNDIRRLINEDKYNQILVHEKYFYINMQHYLLGEHNRLFKITEYNIDDRFRFMPTQNWVNPNKKLGAVSGMFHYSMLLNPWAKFAFWKSEYPGKIQDNKTLWLDKIYRNYDVHNEDKWVEENKKLFDIKSPWFSDSFTPNSKGKLFKYDGKHPDVIEESGLIEIEDFRKKYDFLPDNY